ncbi:uncharacterized protein EAF02_005809 [Botrytis sinoallii]|uniref:uncharacterized protein n=1 Tax=Botrytis sinoallii TaxID=1463999 RepID=UPI001901271E|nr:uncharacterized protein EAF02_005809 [Botrytis sinoallii]KAF7882446.1 hypothetical protein EAF02_005809 [Botrytis sinoallii]
MILNFFTFTPPGFLTLSPTSQDGHLHHRSKTPILNPNPSPLIEPPKPKKKELLATAHIMKNDVKKGGPLPDTMIPSVEIGRTREVDRGKSDKPEKEEKQGLFTKSSPSPAPKTLSPTAKEIEECNLAEAKKATHRPTSPRRTHQREQERKAHALSAEKAQKEKEERDRISRQNLLLQREKEKEKEREKEREENLRRESIRKTTEERLAREKKEQERNHTLQKERAEKELRAREQENTRRMQKRTSGKRTSSTTCARRKGHVKIENEKK